MSGINSISGYSSYYNTSVSNSLSSGKAINSAADDAAGLAIAEKLDNQATGASVAADNARDMNNLLNVSDGALGQISDSLSRIRELSVQASNGIYTDSDRSIFQEEINGLLENIDSIAKQANYNGKPLLDGSFTDQNAAIGPNGESMQINVGSSLVEDLGLKDYDVTSGKTDFKALDDAIELVSTQRASIGAQTNRLEYSANAMENASFNMEVSRSRKEDTDMAQAMMEKNRQNITDQVGVHMQKMMMQGMGNYLALLG